MKAIYIRITPELSAALDAAKGDLGLAAFIERELWRCKSVRDGAKQAGVSNPRRPEESRGRPVKEKHSESITRTTTN